MPGGKSKIGPSDGVETRFKPGKSGNPKGPRVKVFSQIAREYQERGIEKATDQVVKEAFEYLLALPIPEILEIAGNPKAEALNPKLENGMPALLRLMSKDMMGKQGLAAIKEMLNRAHGTPAPKSDGISQIHVTFADDAETPATQALNEAQE